MRKYKRSIARANMIRAGIHHINRKVNGDSFFARNWRGFIN